MQFIIKLILIAVFGFVCSNYLPWWSIIIMSGVITFLIPGNNFNAFLSGFLGIGVLWLAMAWKINVETDAVLSPKVAQLFQIDDSNMLILMTGVIGAFAGALGALTGNSFRQLFLKKKEKSFYN